MKPYLMVNNRALQTRGASLAQQVAGYGLDGLEFSLNDMRLPMGEFYWPRFVESLADVGVLAFHLPFLDVEVASSDPMIARTGVAVLKSYMKRLAPLKPAYLNMHVATDADLGEAHVPSAIANIRELNLYARELGHILCVENVRRGVTSNPRIFRDIVAESGANATIDVGHARGSAFLAAEGGDPLAFFDGIEDRLVTAHIYAIEDAKGHQPIVETDGVDPFLQKFRANGVQYWLLEHHSEEAFRTTLPNVRAWLQNTIQPVE